MDRKEINGLTKIYLLSFLCALPIVIVLDILISKYVPLYILIIIDVSILLISAVIGYIIVEKRKKYIANKRAEFLKNQKD